MNKKTYLSLKQGDLIKTKKNKRNLKFNMPNDITCEVIAINAKSDMGEIYGKFEFLSNMTWNIYYKDADMVSRADNRCIT